MPAPNIDFEGSDVQTPNNGDATENNNNGGGNPANSPDTTDLDNGGTGDINDPNNNNNSGGGNDNNNNNNDNNNNNNDNNGGDGLPHDLEVGTTLEIDGVDYTVAENGDIVDKDGKVFKEAKDVKAWLDENQPSDGEGGDEINIDNLQKQLGIQITTEDGKPAEFTNDAAGVKAYVESVINLKSDEIRQGTMNKFYSDNPLVKQFVDYVQLTGSPKGFGELPDRTGIQLDKDNKEQQIAIIRMAATEFGNKSLNDNYIKYLESTGALYDEAKTQLEALQNKDKQTRKDIETRAAAAREQERQAVEDYFKKVNQVIVSRKLGGYTLPENIVKERNGQKVTLTLNDFYDYVAKSTEVDKDGNIMTGYQRDLNNQSDDELLNKELIDAWLMFTGGSYKDLVAMIAKEDAVRKLVIKSKENSNKHQITVKKPNKSKVNIEDIIL